MDEDGLSQLIGMDESTLALLSVLGVMGADFPQALTILCKLVEQLSCKLGRGAKCSKQQCLKARSESQRKGGLTKKAITIATKLCM